MQRAGPFFTSLVFIIPLVSSALIFADKYGIRIELPVSLAILYFASLSYFVGNLLCDLGCPVLISRFGSAEKFRSYYFRESAERFGESVRATRELEKAIAQIIGADQNMQSKDLRSNVIEAIQNQIALNAGSRVVEIWKKENERNEGMRVAVAMLYTASALLSFFVAVIDAPFRVIRAFGWIAPFPQ